MSIDRSKLLETAQKHVAKGQFAKAIVAFQKLVESDPDDVRSWLRIGDLQTRLGANPLACAAYERVAEHYAKQGIYLKAVAVYKQILQLEPNRLQACSNLAQMYERLDLRREALRAYDDLAAAYAHAGDAASALSTLHRVCELDPDNIAALIKYAEALSQAGHREEAAGAFARGAELLRERDRIDDYMRVAERLLFHRPEDRDTAIDLAQLYCDRGDSRRALAKLQLCFKVDPHHVATLELLAKVFLQLGQPAKATSVLREVVRLHHEAGRNEARARALKQIVDLNPEDGEARRALAALAKPSTPPRPTYDVALDEVATAAVNDDSDVVDVDVDLDDVEVVEEAQTSDAIPADIEREAQVARLVTEAEVFLRYGLKGKAEDQIRAALQLDAQHLGAHQLLKDFLIAEDRLTEALASLRLLRELTEPFNAAAAASYAAQADDMLRRLASQDTAEAATPQQQRTDTSALRSRDTSAARIQRPVDTSADDEVFFVDDSAEMSELPEVSTGSFSSQSELRRRSLVPEDGAEFSGDAIPGVDARTAIDRVDGDNALQGSLELQDAHRAVSDNFGADGSQEHEVVTSRPEAASMTRPVEEVLDEADFFYVQGLFDEAEHALLSALQRHPGHSLILDKLHEYQDAIANAGARTVPPSEDDAARRWEETQIIGTQLAEELDLQIDDTGSEMIDVETVFAQFKKGVAAQVAPEDADTHFDLGIAYKEMGLIDDAIREFETSAHSARRHCLSLTMIGLCHQERGQLTDAIGYFKRGLYAELKTPQEEIGLYYELGSAYEALNDPKEALYYFQKVQRHQPEFRGVSQKIHALSQTVDADASPSHPPRAP